MLCPVCGKDVGDTIKLCDACEEKKAAQQAAAGAAQNENGAAKADAESEGASDQDGEASGEKKTGKDTDRSEIRRTESRNELRGLFVLAVCSTALAVVVLIVGVKMLTDTRATPDQAQLSSPEASSEARPTGSAPAKESLVIDIPSTEELSQSQSSIRRFPFAEEVKQKTRSKGTKG